MALCSPYRRMVLSVVALPLRLLETGLFILVEWYDHYWSKALQKWLSPLIARVPRVVNLGGKDITVFTANIVTWSRTSLVIPITWCIKYGFCRTAFLLVIVNDFLDDVDGITARVQRRNYGPVDDSLLGSFLDAFCDKVVFVPIAWAILMVTDFSVVSSMQMLLFFCPCAVMIGYEVTLGVVRVQDFFQAYYMRKYGDTSSPWKPKLTATMEGKLKEKLESLGIGFLCLAQAYPVAVTSTAGIVGTVCLALSIRCAHASLQHKLTARSVSAHHDQDNQPSTGPVSNGTS